MNVFVFDIETVPDIEMARKFHDFADLSDDEVAEATFAARRQSHGNEFLAHPYHKIVAISAIYQMGDTLNVWSLGDEDADEAEILQRFHNGIDKFEPTLVSWNGTGFDCPVVNYRTLLNGITAAKYWEMGDTIQSYRWNNYQNRYHMRHLDLMDCLSAFQPRAATSLETVATMLGFPGKMGMSGDKVWPTYQAGNLKAIRDYCETDVLNTYLVYLRFELMRARLTAPEFEIKCSQLKTWLTQQDKPHFHEFLSHWQTSV